MVIKKLAKKAIQDRIKGVKGIGPGLRGTPRKAMGPIRAQRKAAQKQVRQKTLIQKKQNILDSIDRREFFGVVDKKGIQISDPSGLMARKKSDKIVRQIEKGGLIRFRGVVGTPRELSLLKQLENWNPKTPFIKQKTVIKKPVVKRYSRAYPSGIPVQDMYKRSRTVNRYTEFGFD